LPPSPTALGIFGVVADSAWSFLAVSATAQKVQKDDLQAQTIKICNFLAWFLSRLSICV
jgi:hypothetical protein